jgi:HTH-type transcriptional regulator/antitoxin HigA
MNLEAQFQLSKVRVADDNIARRADLHSRFPVREMVKRGWVTASKSVDVLEQQLLDFFGIATLQSPISFLHSARKSNADSPANVLQLAWLLRAKKVAAKMVLPPYNEAALRGALSRLSALRVSPEESRHAARILNECGVRFVIVEPIAGSKIDGACFWLTDAQPVVAMTLRLDRIDNFWFVLRHEIEHVLQRHGQEHGYTLDQEIESQAVDQITDEERVANDAAAEFCIDQASMRDFVARVAPFFKEDRVLLFAQRLAIHPGLVVGQLQRRMGRYDLFRKHQVKVRSFVIGSAVTDGWGIIHSD